MGRLLQTEGLTDVQQEILTAVRDFVDNEIIPVAQDLEHSDTYPTEIVEGMKEMGIFGLVIPEEYGGLGESLLTYALCVEEIARGWMSVSGIINTHFIVAYMVMQHGTDAQKKDWLPRMAAGELRGSFSMSEPGCGSDAGALTTTAVRKGDKYILNGSKTYITNAPLANVFVIFATIDKAKRHKGITAFVVERDYPGISTGNPMHKMGCKCSTTSEVYLEDCEVPVENCLGGEGNGWNIALAGVEWDRSTLLSPFVGGMMFMIENCARYANQRFAFGRPIREFQSIQNRIADMKVTLEAAKLAVYRVAASKDNGVALNPLLAAVNKMYVGDRGFEMSSAAVDLFGGYGYIHEYPVERGLRDAKLGQLGGGTSDIMRMIVSRVMMM